MLGQLMFCIARCLSPSLVQVENLRCRLFLHGYSALFDWMQNSTPTHLTHRKSITTSPSALAVIVHSLLRGLLITVLECSKTPRTETMRITVTSWTLCNECHSNKNKIQTLGLRCKSTGAWTPDKSNHLDGNPSCYSQPISTSETAEGRSSPPQGEFRYLTSK